MPAPKSPRAKLIHDAAEPAPSEVYHLNARTLVEAVDDHTRELAATNEYLKEIAGLASMTLSFFKKWLPIGIGVVGILYPSMGKVIDKLGPLLAQ